MKKIKAILFDLDGTLRHSLPTSGEVFLEHIRSIGLQVSEEDRIRAEHWIHFYFAYSPELQADLKIFKDDSKGFWVNFTQRRLVASGILPAQASELAPQVSAYMGESYKPEVHVPEDARVLLKFLQESGYILIFKPTLERRDHGKIKVKGNVDAELVLHTMIEYPNYDKAIIVSGDGDFYCLAEYLQKKNKLLKILTPTKHYSSLLRRFNTQNYIVRIDLLRGSLEQKKTGIRGRSKP